MDAELKAKWVEALRSGRFEQGAGNFEKGGKFCCLGVLCKVAGEPTRAMGSSNWCFVREEAFDGDKGDTRMLLATMNDNGASFSEIADYIEANL